MSGRNHFWYSSRWGRVVKLAAFGISRFESLNWTAEKNWDIREWIHSPTGETATRKNPLPYYTIAKAKESWFIPKDVNNTPSWYVRALLDMPTVVRGREIVRRLLRSSPYYLMLAPTFYILVLGLCSSQITTSHNDAFGCPNGLDSSSRALVATAATFLPLHQNGLARREVVSSRDNPPTETTKKLVWVLPFWLCLG